MTLSILSRHGERRHKQLSAFAELTSGINGVYLSTSTTPGSLGERALSRSDRGGSCFLVLNHDDNGGSSHGCTIQFLR